MKFSWFSVIIWALCMIALASILIAFVSAIYIIVFDPSSSSENLTFTGNQNITRNITIYKNANVTSAYLNLSGYRDYWGSFKNNFLNTTQGTTLDNPNQINDSLLTSITRCNAGVYYDVTHNYCANEFNYTIPAGANLSGVTKAKVLLYGYCSNTNDNMIDILWKSESYDSGNWQDSGFALDNEDIQCAGSSGGVNNMALININEAISGDLTIRINTIFLAGQNGLVAPRELRVLFYNSTNATWGDYLGTYPTSDGSTRFDLLINNTAVWSKDSQINDTDNKTSDLSVTLNTALNSGACDCSGCVLSGNNCSIPFIFDNFHRYDYGILQYSAINITWLEYTNPNLSVISPNGTYSGITYVPISINASDDWQLDKCWYNVTRGASLEVDNTYITNCSTSSFTVSGDANYIFRVCVNDTSSNLNCTTSNFTTTNYVLPPSAGGGGSSTTIIEKLTTPIANPVCTNLYPSVKSKWKEFTNDPSFARFKIIWFAFWNYGLCDSSASLIPMISYTNSSTS